MPRSRNDCGASGLLDEDGPVRRGGGALTGRGAAAPAFQAPIVRSSTGRSASSVTSPTTTSSAFPGRQ